MRAPALLLALSLFGAGSALAETPPLSADAFDGLVTGRTILYGRAGLPYGVEEYLPGRRVRWQATEDDCQYGSWYPKGEMICFSYDFDGSEHCWTFREEEGRITALAAGADPLDRLEEMIGADARLNCPAPDVGV